MNVNKIIITGNLTADPELRYTPSGKAVLSASIANNEHFTDAQGQEQKVTTFVNFEVWGRPAENFGKLVKKGHELFLDGNSGWTNGPTNKPTHAAQVSISWSTIGNSPNSNARRRALPMLPLPLLPPLQCLPTREKPRER
jgi:single-strand DNA-binding protein